MDENAKLLGGRSTELEQKRKKYNTLSGFKVYDPIPRFYFTKSHCYIVTTISLMLIIAIILPIVYGLPGVRRKMAILEGELE